MKQKSGSTFWMNGLEKETLHVLRIWGNIFREDGEMGCKLSDRFENGYITRAAIEE